MNYKQINENWQTYQLVEYLLEDRSYVTGVLGIELPLNESGQVSLTQELKEQIITEHLLLENFLTDLVATAKKSAGNIKNLFAALAKIIQGGTESIKRFMDLLRTKGLGDEEGSGRGISGQTKLITQDIQKLADKLPDSMPTFKKALLDIKQKLTALVNWLRSLAPNWKNLMITTTVAVLIKFFQKKVGEKIKDFLTDQTGVEGFIGKIQSFVEERLTKVVGAEVMKKLTDVKSYLGWIGPIVGGVQFVADAISDTTQRIAVPRKAITL